MKKIAILQSNYIPWKGYFDIIASVDEFIIHDNLQYTKRDWRNRNLIKYQNGTKWLSIPVQQHHQTATILDILVSEKNWTKNHFNILCENYRKAEFFHEYKEWLAKLYQQANQETHLSQINILFIKEICKLLGIDTKISYAWEMPTSDDKNLRLINLCKHVGADVYISGPAAKCYLDIPSFNKENIQVEWMDYSSYPEYPQKYPPFEHGVSILDLIFNTGKDARNYMKY